MLSFTRSVSENLMNLQFERVGIKEEMSLNDESDQIISNGKFSAQSLHVVINYHGVKPVFVHAVWKLKIHPRL